MNVFYFGRLSNVHYITYGMSLLISDLELRSCLLFVHLLSGLAIVTMNRRQKKEMAKKNSCSVLYSSELYSSVV